MTVTRCNGQSGEEVFEVNDHNNSAESVRRDAAVAAAAVIIEEFFPHCPNGLVAPISERLCEIVEAAIDSVFTARAEMRAKPSLN
jgi:hypothetical protein